jgi:hypothetical protein
LKTFPEKLRIVLINVRVFERLQGFLKAILVELRLFWSDVRLFKKSEAFYKFDLKHLKRNGGFFQ